MGSAAGHYFDPEPGGPSSPRQVELHLPDLSLRLTTDRGVFAGAGVDPGTKLLLLEAPAPPAAGALVDLGCGYGPLALTMAARSPHATVWAVDVNRRALGLCEANAAANGLANVVAATPGDVPADLRIAALWSNPPIRIGKAALHELLLQWLPRLDDGAHAWLVVQKHLGADSLARWLGEQGWPARRHASRGGYRILDVTQPGRQDAGPLGEGSSTTSGPGSASVGPDPRSGEQDARSGANQPGRQDAGDP